MNAYPFSVFKRTDRPCFLVSFKDDTGKYLPPLSTKKKTEQVKVVVRHLYQQEDGTVIANEMGGSWKVENGRLYLINPLISFSSIYNVSFSGLILTKE